MNIYDMPAHIRALLNSFESSQNWPAPEPLLQQPPPVPQVTRNMLPKEIADVVFDEAERMGCPPDYIAVAILCALGSLIGTTVGVRPKQHDHWTVHPNLWGAIVALPGSKKSAAQSAGFRNITRLNHEAQAKHKQDMAQAALNRKITDSQIKQLDHQLKATLRAERDAAAKGAPAPTPSSAQLQVQLDTLTATSFDVPPPRRLYTSDATVEALGILAEGNPRGLLVSQDELMSLFLTFEKPGRETDRQAYLVGWAGDHSLHIDRVSRDPLYIPRFCLTVFGGIQPDVFMNYVMQAGSNLNNDGLIQRLQLLVYPDALPPQGVVDRSPDMAAAQVLSQVFDFIAEDRHVLIATRDSRHESAFFKFEAETAQPAFFKWMTANEVEVQNLGEHMLAQHLCKYPKLVSGLALIFHLVGIASKTSKAKNLIEFASLKMALLWSDYLYAHAKRIYGMAAAAKYRSAHALADRLMRQEITGDFTARGIQRKGWSNLRELEDVNQAIKELEAAHWLRPIEAKNSGTPGRPPGKRYEINPGIFQMGQANTVPTKPTKPPRPVKGSRRQK